MSTGTQRMARIVRAARLGFGALLLIACSGAWAQWWNPASPIAPGKWAVYGRNFKYTQRTRDEAVQVIESSLQEGDFRKLDRMHDEFLEMFKANGNGRQMLGSFQDGLRYGFPADAPDKYAKLFADWRASNPESRLRPVAEAVMWSDLAWRARGGGYASEVSPEAFKIFHERLARAVRILQESEAHGRETPLWHWMAVGVAGSLGEPAPVLDAFLDEGAAKFPVFMPLFQTRLNFLLPEWGGDYDRVDAFIRHAVRLTDAREGTTLYAELYRQVHGSFHGADFFRETRASWPLMKHAFEDEAAQGKVDLDTYATYACMARDRETTRELLRELGDDANLGAGMQGYTTETCAEMVKEGK